MKNYSITIDGRLINITHDDINKDGIVQKTEKVSIHNGSDRFDSGTAGFNRLRQIVGLPDFRDLPIATWYKTHETLLGKTLSKAQEEQYTAIYDFCKERKIPFFQVSQLASKMLQASVKFNHWTKEKYPAAESLKALIVASVLLSLPKDKFYAKNKKFVDKVTNLVRNGKLKIDASAQGSDSPEMSITAIYRYESDSLFLVRPPNPTDPTIRMTIVHELYHFYQDSQAKPLSKLEVEKQASIKGSEYAVLDQKLDSEEKVRTFINAHHLSEESPKALGIWVAYHQLKQSKEMNSWVEKLEDAIHETYFAKTYIVGLLNPILSQAKRNIQSEFDAKEFLRKEIARLNADIGKETGGASAYLGKQGRIYDEEIFNTALAPLLNHLIYRAIYKKCLAALQSGKLNLNINTEEDPEFKEVRQALKPLRLGKYLYRQYDGVKSGL